jgi:cation diffusion facilitator family transporter
MSSNLREEYIVKRRVTLVCAGWNLALSVIKVVLGVVGQSQALVADGIHSLSDLVSDAMVLLAVRFASQEADQEHPYGHARFETITIVALGVLLLIVAGGIVLDAVERIKNPSLLLQPGLLAMSGAVFSILLKEWMYRYTLRVAKELNSGLMRANAWHHRSDAISSVIVLAGIAGTMMGFPLFDAVGAIGVAVLIGKIGWDLGRGGISELVDTGVDPAELEVIRNTIESIDGVESFHDLRTRKMGHQVLVEVHVLVGSQVTVSEGHRIGDCVRERLLREHPDVSEVLVHVDPEDDALVHMNASLPGREEMNRLLQDCWQSYELAGQVERINLHYLQGKIDVELILPLASVEGLAQARELAEQLARLTETEKYVGRVGVFFYH